ncbi:uncharacterized protein Dyak_GE13112 [Drosophila yakuba]|uniref:Uncharacterized protein n=1 Tax=Drosophila yakuba TaxID=7245 RepID=B4P889_DROYA|nr:uncharacterized protein Dyak_GE13112 [Drosophila yakuba]
MIRFARFLFDEFTNDREAMDCVSHVRRNLNLAASMLYKERFFEPSAFSASFVEINNMFEELRRQFLLKVDQNHLELTAWQKNCVVRKAEKSIDGFELFKQPFGCGLGALVFVK